MHAKYGVSISYGSKVIAYIKGDNRKSSRQTGQKQYAPDHPGHKNVENVNQNIFDALLLCDK